MDRFVADLHIHSRFSRATSKKLNARLLAAWAMVKGIDVLGTGDFTHPEWIAELEELLHDPDGSGLYTLKDPSGLADELDWTTGPLAGQTKFMLQAEISSIYKKGGKVRKNHNLVYMPDFESAKRFNEKLGMVGNLKSDGRPILGLDARDLLEIVLSIHPKAFLIPAHVWTPWFSLFGSKSGFDDIKECFQDLTSEIFALETGLSSDPEMNWLWSKLDKYKLVSNSDAHSGEKLAREANLFEGELSYDSIYRALRDEGLGHKFLGTLEFFPEEGKYHLDGHRKCQVVMEPEETISRGGICPVCGKPVTTGVLTRVLALSDRAEPVQPAGMPGYVSLIPLKEIISEVVGTGPNTKKVAAMYTKLIAAFGSELDVLRKVPGEDLSRISPPLAEGIERMRKGRVIRTPGFDGQYGIISVFTPQEKKEMKQGKSLIRMTKKPGSNKPTMTFESPAEAKEKKKPVIDYNYMQKQAIEAGPEPVLVLAGPGTGKTQTLMGRINRLLDQGENPRHILAVTFTRKAAEELRQRLANLRGENDSLPRADTLHALAFDHWAQSFGSPPVVMGEDESKRVFAGANPELTGAKLSQAWNHIQVAREKMGDFEPYGQALTNYFVQKDSWDLVDYTDLMEFWVEQIDSKAYVMPYTHVLVDEVQDLSNLQLEVVKKLSGNQGRGFFAIGDPAQSIYGFRGACVDVGKKLKNHWPDMRAVSLVDNYRSTQSILDVAHKVIPEQTKLVAKAPGEGEIQLFQAPTAEREASWIGERIKSLLGSTSHSLADQLDEKEGYTPSDVAVLVRFKALIPTLERILSRMGVPVSVPEKEAFWTDPRISVILNAAGKMLGLGQPEDVEEEVQIPEKVLTQGPVGLHAYLQDMSAFDRLFWESRQFKELVKRYDEFGGWGQLMTWINLKTELDMVGTKAEKVRIMTIHASKGLEFKAVFLPALEDGIIPFAGMNTLMGKGKNEFSKNDCDEQEEKRLLYVGITRAEKNVYLSHSGKRTVFGKTLMLRKSRFLNLLPEDMVKRSALVARKVVTQKQATLL